MAGAGAFGVFFRWMQGQMAFDDLGLPEKSFWNVMVPLSIFIVGYVFSRFIDNFRNRRCFLPEEYTGALRNEGKLYAILRWLIGGLMCIGALLVLATCETDKNASLLKVIALFAALTGVTFPLLLSAANKTEEELKHPLLCLFCLMPILMYAVWLVFSYKENAINSVVWDYAIEIVTVSFVMCSFFRAAGFAFGQPNIWRTMFFAMVGAFLCIMSLADERNIGLQVILLSSALMLIFYNWVMSANLLTKKEAERREAPQDGFERLR